MVWFKPKDGNPQFPFQIVIIIDLLLRRVGDRETDFILISWNTFNEYCENINQDTIHWR